MSDVIPGKWKPVYRIVNNLFAQGRPIFFPPGTPKVQVKTLEKAFRDLHEDPAFLEAADKMGVRVAPTYGEDVLRPYKDILAEPKEQLDIIAKKIRRERSLPCCHII